MKFSAILSLLFLLLPIILLAAVPSATSRVINPRCQLPYVNYMRKCVRPFPVKNAVLRGRS